MPETHYSLAVIRAAFWATFNESGERWFGYFGTPGENSSHTEGTWDEFAEELATAQHDCLAPAISAIRAIDASRREDEMFLCQSCLKDYEHYMPQIHALMTEWRERGIANKLTSY